MYQITKHPLVDCDIEEAALWYARRDREVAQRFLDEVRHAMKAAAQNPLQYPNRFRDARRVWVHGFPHSVFFKFRGETVFVLAVLHGARQLEQIIGHRSLR